MSLLEFSGHPKLPFGVCWRHGASSKQARINPTNSASLHRWRHCPHLSTWFMFAPVQVRTALIFGGYQYSIIYRVINFKLTTSTTIDSFNWLSRFEQLQKRLLPQRQDSISASHGQMAVEKRTDPLVQVERSETVIQDLRMAPGAPIEAGWPDSGKNNQQLSVKSSINDGLKRGPVGGDMSFLLVTNCTPWKLSWPACQYRLWPECYACLEVIPSMPRTDTLQAGLKFSGSLGQLRFYAILLPSALDSESPHHNHM